MLEIYCGNGKGKTTAAMGLALRALGRGEKVYVAQFLKSANSGELAALARLGAVLQPGPAQMKFLFQMTQQEKELCRRETSARFQEAADFLRREKPFVAVLDEVLDAAECGLIPQEELLQLARDCREETELVFTGRRYSPQLGELADYITRMEKVKHPFDRGLSARPGVEF